MARCHTVRRRYANACTSTPIDAITIPTPGTAPTIRDIQTGRRICFFSHVMCVKHFFRFGPHLIIVYPPRASTPGCYLPTGTCDELRAVDNCRVELPLHISIPFRGGRNRNGYFFRINGRFPIVDVEVSIAIGIQIGNPTLLIPRVSGMSTIRGDIA